jgi:hypothetical protein
MEKAATFRGFARFGKVQTTIRPDGRGRMVATGVEILP